MPLLSELGSSVLMGVNSSSATSSLLKRFRLKKPNCQGKQKKKKRNLLTTNIDYAITELQVGARINAKRADLKLFRTGQNAVLSEVIIVLLSKGRFTFSRVLMIT